MNVSILSSIVGLVILVIVFNVLLPGFVVVLELSNDLLLPMLEDLLLLGDLGSEALGGRGHVLVLNGRLTLSHRGDSSWGWRLGRVGQVALARGAGSGGRGSTVVSSTRAERSR